MSAEHFSSPHTQLVAAEPTGSAWKRPRTTASAAFSWPLAFGAFAVLAAIGIAKARLTAASTPLVNDTDDAMRLVTVRDLLAGQGWWDHIQHRLDAPFGAEIHWSHLLDAAIGGLMLGLHPLLGGNSETVTLFAWPLLLALALVVLCGRIAFRLGGADAVLPAVLLPIAAPALITEFSPGRIDHHSIQILLTLLMAWGALEAITRPRFALLAGIAAALSLEIGIEGLPSVLSAIVALGCIWAIRPQSAAGLRYFGISFAAGTMLLELQHFPPERWFVAACDEISPVYVAFAAGVGVVFLGLSLLPLARARPIVRLAIGGGAGGMLALVLAMAFPLCLKGPYAAMDPWLVRNWLDQITEARPVWDSFAATPAFTLAVVIPPVLGLVAIAVRLRRGPAERRGEWLVLGLFLAIAIAVMGMQIRGARLAAPLAFPAAGWLIAVARERYLRTRRPLAIAGLVGSWLGFAGIAIGLAAAAIMAPFGAGVAKAGVVDETAACRMPSAFTALAALPPARVMAPIDLGSHLLAFTPHSVVAAPYQRDEDGVRDAFRFFNDPLPAAHAILDRRGVTLVVLCPGMPEIAGLASATPDSFARLYAKGGLPTWLTPLPLPGTPLKIFSVSP